MNLLSTLTHRNIRHFNVLIIFIGICNSTMGQSLADLATMPRPVANAVAITNPPIIDGQVSNDSIWRDIPTIGTLTQSQPNAGFPASENTDIRIAYTSTHLYVSVVCFDKNPDGLVISDARRDADLNGSDAILLIFDTYHDTQNGFVFGTNPSGVQYDGQVDNEGQGNFNQNRQQGGTIGGFNLNWDASWEVATTVDKDGWNAEFSIPLKTIRFRSGDNVTWGLNIQRNIQKTNERSYWSPLPINFNLYRLSYAGTLTNLDLKSPGNLKVMPYVLSELSKAQTDLKSDLNADVGVDLKYSITPNMTLDVTYNTDFAQVEVDDQQVNLDRFNLFFPEKRLFFLENAGLFSVGSPSEVDLFFTRRIGIGENGQQVPIIGGARMSGKTNRTNIGLLSMFTDETDEQAIGQNSFSVARINHEFKGRSALGAIFTNRTGIGDERGEDNNSLFAIDGKLGLGQKARIIGYAAKSSTPGLENSDHSFQLKANYEWNGWQTSVGYTEVGENFNPEMGFLFRKAFRKPEFLVLYKLRAPASSPFLEFRPHISYRGYWNLQGFQESGFLHIDNHWQWKSGTEVHTGVNFTTEGVVAPFMIAKEVTIPAGTYDHAETLLVFFTNRNKPFAVSTRHTLGGFFGGKRYANSVTVFWRIGDKFTSEWGINRNDIHLPYGSFSTDIARARISYAFTPNIFLQSLIQYNSVTKQFSSNIRFGWLQQANTGLFIVYNETRDDGLIDNRNFIVKYSVLLDVLK